MSGITSPTWATHARHTVIPGATVGLNLCRPRAARRGRKIACAHLAVARSLATLLRWGLSRSAALLQEMVAFSPFRRQTLMSGAAECLAHHFVGLWCCGVVREFRLVVIGCGENGEQFIEWRDIAPVLYCRDRHLRFGVQPRRDSKTITTCDVA